MNNLLERLHHAYWFYLLPSSNLFIPIGVYIGPVILLAAGLLIYVLCEAFADFIGHSSFF
jgi:hypothetical protein